MWLVEFYAPCMISQPSSTSLANPTGCGHCKNLKPTWERLAKQLKGVVKVAAVNCDEHQQLAAQFGVRGFPTIKLFPSQLIKQGNGFKKEPMDYNVHSAVSCARELDLREKSVRLH